MFLENLGKSEFGLILDDIKEFLLLRCDDGIIIMIKSIRIITSSFYGRETCRQMHRLGDSLPSPAEPSRAHQAQSPALVPTRPQTQYSKAKRCFSFRNSTEVESYDLHSNDEPGFLCLSSCLWNLSTWLCVHVSSRYLPIIWW